VFTRETNPCPGAELNLRKCNNCKSFHLCCKEQGIQHCYECKKFPCTKLKRFSKSWEKYGQVILENQKLLQKLGDEEFKRILSAKTNT